jgi:hypothetical protein
MKGGHMKKSYSEFQKKCGCVDCGNHKQSNESLLSDGDEVVQRLSHATTRSPLTGDDLERANISLSWLADNPFDNEAADSSDMSVLEK